MKKRIILSLSIFLLSFSCLFAQTIYTRTDTIPVTLDSVTFQAGEFRGFIQWQHSADEQTWEDLSGKTQAELKIAGTAAGYYRAEITDGTCFPVYSDTAQIKFCNCDVTRFEYFTDSRDGHTYKIFQIGTQTWMAENLAYLPYTTPTSTYSYTDPCYYVYDYNSYGVLYNWPAALNACPAGWHLPSDDEWTILSNYLGGNEVAGGKVKSTIGWNSPNTGATNESCFSALPGGYYGTGIGYIGFSGSGDNGFWWSSTANGENVAWYRSLGQRSSELGRYDGFSKRHGFSVRCVRD